MGGSNSSSTKILQEALTQITVSAVVSSKSVSHSSTSMGINIEAVGKNSVVDNIDILQKSQITVQSILDTEANADMQADIVNKLTQKALTEQSNENAFIGRNRSETDLTTIISTSVSNYFSVSALQEMSNNIAMDISISAVDEGSFTNSNIEQSAKTIASQASSLASDIVSKIGVKNEAHTEAETKQKNSVSLFGGLFAILLIIGIGVFMFYQSISPILIIVTILCLLGICIGGYFLLK